MVTHEPHRRGYPACRLARIQELAADERVIYAASQVQLDTASLNYSLSTVCACICALTPEHFLNSLLYPGSTLWYDAYKIDFAGPNSRVDSLYIKFTLSQDCLLVSLFSFHRDR
jgi:hypothetical protein